MAVKFSHTNQSHFYLKSYSSLYHNLRRNFGKEGCFFNLVSDGFFYLNITILYDIIFTKATKNNYRLIARLK